MNNFLFYDSPLKENSRSAVLLLLRLFIGFMMLTHGWAKLTNFDTLSASFPDPLGVGSMASLVMALLAEVGCSLLLIFGIFTRLAVLPLIFNMIVAAFVVHAGAGLQGRELAIMYLAMYILVFFMGGGRYAIDRFFLK